MSGDRRDILVRQLATVLRKLINFHRSEGMSDIFLFSTPRSGSTWVMELIGSQPGFKSCNEPLNIRNPVVQKHLGITDWSELYNDASQLRLEAYFRAYCEGRLKIRDPLPGRGWRRFFTRRIVFKIINGAEGRVEWFRRTFGGHVFYLLRHPLAVALSRKELPRLDACLNSDYRRLLTTREIEIAEEVVREGSPLERGVLSWCLQNTVPLRQRSSEWLVFTYEQLVLEPEPVVAAMAVRGGLPEPGRLLRRLGRPSSSARKSDERTREFLDERSHTGTRTWLIEKWQDGVRTIDLSGVRNLLAAFALDMYYTVDDTLPSERIRLPSPVGTPRD